MIEMSDCSSRQVEVIIGGKRHFVTFYDTGMVSVMTEVFRKGKAVRVRNTSAARVDIIAQARGEA